MDETALIRSAIKGDLDAFNRLALAYQQMAYNLACRMLNDDDLAEDATQTAFISAYRSLKSYRGGSFRSWLLRIVTNACYDELRRMQRHPTSALEPVSEADQQEMESPAWMEDQNAPDPQENLESAELEHAIQHCLEKLPKEFRAVVVMVDIEGLEYEEAAHSASVPLGTVKSRLTRARLRLRDCLRGFGELLPARYRLTDEEVL